MQVMFVVVLVAAVILLAAVYGRKRSVSRNQRAYGDGTFMFVDSGGSWSSSDCGSSDGGGGGCDGGGGGGGD
jgi:uncharacterized membrane protein YgcG